MKKSHILFRMLAFFLCVQPLFAGELFYSSDPDVGVFHLPGKIIQDVPNLATPDNAFIGIIGGGLALGDGIALDPSNPWPSGLQSFHASGLWDFGNFYGQGWVEGFGAVGAWAWGGVSSDLRLAEFGRDATESLALATVLVTGLKYTFRRERPDGSNNLSFPSGHTITAFCVAPVIEKYGGDELGIPAYALAALTGLSRVEGKHHYLSDVLVGATLGILIGNMAVGKSKALSVSAGVGRASVSWNFN
ncbi:MAG: phosphatase PAP2 family protein [bacterium]